jgi:hypothetical protein
MKTILVIGMNRGLGTAFFDHRDIVCTDLCGMRMPMEFVDAVECVSIAPARLITELAQVDANLTPEEAAQRVISCWETGNLTSVNGILQVGSRSTYTVVKNRQR